MKYKYVLSVIAVMSLSSLFAMEEQVNVLGDHQELFHQKMGSTVIPNQEVAAEDGVGAVNLAKSINDYEDLKNQLLGLNYIKLGHLLAQNQGNNGELGNAFIQSFVCARLLAAAARHNDIQIQGDTRKFMANITLMSIFNPNKVMNIF